MPEESSSIDDFLNNPPKSTTENILKDWERCCARYVPRPLTREENRRFEEVLANQLAAQQTNFILGEPISKEERLKYRRHVNEHMRKAGFY